MHRSLARRQVIVGYLQVTSSYHHMPAEKVMGRDKTDTFTKVCYVGANANYAKLSMHVLCIILKVYSSTTPVAPPHNERSSASY